MSFSLFHPIRWINETTTNLLSFRTLICLILLFAVVILYGICLGKQYLYNLPYCSNRAVRIYKTTLQNSIFFAVHVIFGIVAAWIYLKFSINKWNETICIHNRYCFSENYLITTLNGIYISCYFFMIQQNNDNMFCIIQQNVFIKIRSIIFMILRKSLIKSIGPLTFYLIVYGLLRNSIISHVTYKFDVDIVYISIIDMKRLFFLWLLDSYILCNLTLINQFFKIFTEKYARFAISEETNDSSVTITQALSSNINGIRKLGSFDLFTLSSGNDKMRRMQIFSLSMPGGHPYNWKMLCTKCLEEIDSYCDKLSKAYEKVTLDNKNNLNALYQSKTIGVMFGNKLRFRQYNEKYGIRNMTMFGVNVPVENVAQKRIFDFTNSIKLKLTNIKLYIMNLPGIYYLFAENCTSQIDYHLRDIEFISWISQGLSNLAAHSMEEDKFGVVHNNLAQIMTSLLKLKIVLDKIYDIKLDNRSTQLKCAYLRNALRRCLFDLRTTFEEHLEDLVPNPTDFY